MGPGPEVVIIWLIAKAAYEVQGITNRAAGWKCASWVKRGLGKWALSHLVDREVRYLVFQYVPVKHW